MPFNHTYHGAQRVLQVYGGIVLFSGIPANILSGIVFASDRTNRSTTRILMVLLAIADTLVLVTAMLRYWIRETFGEDIRNIHPVFCRVHVFTMAFCSDFAVGTLCSVAVERFLLVAFPHMSNVLVTTRTIFFGFCAFVVGIAGKNACLFWLIDYIVDPDTGRNLCTAKSKYRNVIKIFAKVDLISYSMIPYIILFFCNMYIYIVLRRQSHLFRTSRQSTGSLLSRRNTTRGRNKRKPQNAIKILTALTVLHFITTLPGTIFIFIKVYLNLMQKKDAQTKAILYLLYDGLLMLAFTNNALNFIAYLLSSPQFRYKLLTLLHLNSIRRSADGDGEEVTGHAMTTCRIKGGQSVFSNGR